MRTRRFRCTINLKAPDSFFVPRADMPAFSDGAVGARLRVAEETRAGVAIRYAPNGDDPDTYDYYACWINDSDLFGCIRSVAGQ